MDTSPHLRGSVYAVAERRYLQDLIPTVPIVVGVPGVILFVLICFYCQQHTENRRRVDMQAKANAYAQTCAVQGTKVYMNPELFGYPPYNSPEDTYIVQRDTRTSSSKQVKSVKDPIGFAVVSETVVTVFQYIVETPNAKPSEKVFSYTVDDLVQHRVFIIKDNSMPEDIFAREKKPRWNMVIGQYKLRRTYGFLSALLNAMCAVNNLDPAILSGTAPSATVVPFQGELPIARVVEDDFSYDK